MYKSPSPGNTENVFQIQEDIMKKFAIFALVFTLALALCACRMGKDENPEITTDNGTQNTAPQVTTPIIDPTMGTNVPDTNVDDTHLNPEGLIEDLTGGASKR